MPHVSSAAVRAAVELARLANLPAAEIIGERTARATAAVLVAAFARERHAASGHRRAM